MNINDFYIADYCRNALDMARNISEVTLDYSRSSLAGLDTVLKDLRRIRKKGLLKDESAWSAAVSLGTYYGEVMLRDSLQYRDFAWKIDQSGMPVISDEKGLCSISPIYRAYKAITGDENGPSPEENYKMFLFMLDHAEEEYRKTL